MEKRTNENAVLIKAVNIVEYMSKYPDGITLSEIAKGMGINITTVYRIINTLVNHGYVTQNSKNGAYRLGYQFLFIAERIKRLPISTLVLPTLNDYSEHNHMSASLVQLEDDKIVNVAVASAQPLYGVTTNPVIGYHGPLYCNASGKVFLACYSDEKLDIYLSTHSLDKISARTITDPDLLRKDLEATRERGYAIDDKETGPITISLSAPVRNDKNSVVYAINATALDIQIQGKEQLQKTGEELLNVAEKISFNLGCNNYRAMIHHFSLD